MKIFIETQNLLFREITLDDVDAMFELDSDPEVHRYLGNNPVQEKTQITEAINFIRKQYADNGIGRWAVVNKATGEFMGWSGLKLVTTPTNNHKDYLDLGYRLIKRFWGKGFAMESAKASLNYAFETLGHQEVFAMAHIENIGSNKILKNLGFSWVEIFQDEAGDSLNWYRIAAQDYKSAK